MPGRLVIDAENRLQESGRPSRAPQPVLIRGLANFFSYIFHPVFVPIYMVLFMLYIHPYLFVGITAWDKVVVLLRAFLMFTFFPLVTVLLLRALDFISSIHLKTQKDRIIPYVICIIWYFWAWYVSRNLAEYPKEYLYMALAIFIASWIGLLANINSKISMHAISMGVLATFFVSQFIREPGFGVYVALVLLIAGLVCTARFIVADHTQKEVYLGLLVGIFAQLIAAWLG